MSGVLSLRAALVVLLVVVSGTTFVVAMNAMRAKTTTPQMTIDHLTSVPAGKLRYPGAELVSTFSRGNDSSTLDDASAIPALVQTNMRSDSPLDTIIEWYSAQEAMQGWTLRGRDIHTHAALFTESNVDLIIENSVKDLNEGASTHSATYSIILAEAPAGCPAFPPPRMLGIQVPGEGSPPC